MEERINFLELYRILKKRFIIIIITILISLLASSVITFFVMTPSYEASTQILVNQSQNENEELSSSDLQSSRELISTYNVIMTSPAILDPVVQNSNFEGSVGELRSKVDVEAEEESQVATVTIEDTDPRRAVNLVNTLAQTFEEEISGIMDVDNVSILAQAQIEDSDSPVSPRPAFNLAVALLLGLVIGVGIAFVLEFLDKSIKTEQDIEKELNLPLLGTVPIMLENDAKKENNNMRANLRGKTKKSF